MIESLGQVALTVRDVERSVAFYRDASGSPFCSHLRRRWRS